jgi:hypothetical protein
MSLKAFHIAFIVLSTLLSFGFGLWCLLDSSARGNTLLLALGVFSFIADAGLIWYGIHFLRKLKGVSYL